jgi:hypothetical protein
VLVAAHGARLDRLPLVSRRLLHLELSAPLPAGLGWAPSLRQLTCLSLAGCTEVHAASLLPLQALPQVMSASVGATGDLPGTLSGIQPAKTFDSRAQRAPAAPPGLSRWWRMPLTWPSR